MSNTTNISIKKWFLIGLLVLIGSICSIGIIPKVNAEGVDLGVYPPIIQIDAEAPALIENPISIENFLDQTVNLSIIYRPFKPLENGDIEYIEGEEAVEFEPLFSKITIYDSGNPVERLMLSPKQTKDLTLRIDITEEQKRSDFYFSVIFISEDLASVGSTKSLAIGGIATNVLLSVGPREKIEGRISQFSAPFFLLKGPVPFQMKMANDSSHYITVNGIITIRDIFGKTVGKMDILPVNILGHSERIMVSQDIENSKLEWREKFLLGAYSAKAVVGLSEEGPVVSKTTTFLALPLELIGGVLISILIVSYIIKRVREKQKLGE